jgi:Tfp pilus assembly protein PilE
MMVVVIIGILATIGGAGYGRWISKARKGEVTAMLAEISAKEQIYLMEFGAFHPLRADGSTAINPPAAETAAAFFPFTATAAQSAFFSRTIAATIANPAVWPLAWRNVGLRPKARELYCTYMANAGAPGIAPPAGSVGLTLLPTAGDYATNWFYAVGACNFTGAAAFPADVTIMALTHNSMVVREINDGR